MASREEVNNQKELNKEKRQTANIDQDINKEQEKSLSLEEQILDLLAKRRGIDSQILSDQQDIANVLNDQVKQMQFQAQEKKLIKQLSSSITAINEKAYSITSDQLGTDKALLDIAKDTEKLEKSIILLEQQKVKLLAEGGELNIDIAHSLEMQSKQALDTLNQLKKVAKTSKTISQSLGVKSFSGLSEISKSIPGLSKFSEPFENAAEASRETARFNLENFGTTKNLSKENLKILKSGKGLNAAKIKELNLESKLIGKNGKLLTGQAAAQKAQMLGLTKSMNPFMAGVKSLGPSLTKALGPVALIAEAVKTLMMVDKTSGEIAKSMGISAAEGAKLAASSADAAAMSGDLLVSTKDVVAAQMELNQAMGTSVEFSGEFAAEFASIKERTGLSNEAMAMFSQNALVAGTSIKEQLSTVSATVMELNAQSGVMLNAKDIQEGIAKMSKAQLLSAGRNTEELTKQVYQAKLLGVNMQQLESIGESLLNFESSIANEMEAELLTGRQLNLEGARLAALEGDRTKLAAELSKEVGTAAEFSDMNVIAQEALAKSFGMSKDEMAEMLINQENLLAVQKAGFESQSDAQKAFNKLIEDGMTAEQAAAEMKRKGLDDAFTAQMKSTTQQEKLNAAMDKLTDIFVQIVDPLIPVMDAIMAILDPIFAILSPIAKLIGDIVGLTMGVLAPAIKVVVGALTFDFDMILGGFKSLGAGILNFFGTLGQPLLDILLAPIDGIINMLNFIPGIELPDISQTIGGEIRGAADSMIGLAEGGIVTEPTTALIGEGGEPEAVTPLSKIGSFVSDIMGRGEQETISPIDIGPLVTQMSQMNSTLQAILAKEGTVTLDGTKVGTALTVANSKLQ